MSKQLTVIKKYKGSQQAALDKFQTDSEKMAADGYRPTSQSWAPGAYGCGEFLLALILCFVLIGFLIFVYMLIVKPDGTLTVTYELTQASSAESALASGESKICPQCAETVKAAALICRFCGHKFEQT